MKIPGVTLLMVLLVSLPAAGQADQATTISEKELMELVASIPIKRMQVPPEVRDKQRSEGRPVMLVMGQPGYLYRDFVRASVRRAQRMPQENPDYQGCVTVSFEILADGKTSAFEVVKSDPKGVFDKHALGAVFATEYEPAPAPASAGPAPRHQRSIWFLVARPPRGEVSTINKVVEEDRNRRREELRVACEGPAL